MLKPDQFLDIEEQCIPWKFRHKYRCYNKAKPVKRLFKVLSLMNERISGYQDRGKAEDRPEDTSATSFPAKVLPNQDKYNDRNFILCTDNWFTSFEQLQICMECGGFHISTVQKKCKDIPFFSWKPDHGQWQTQQ